MHKRMAVGGLVGWSLACGGVGEVAEVTYPEALKPVPVEDPDAWKPKNAEEALPLLVGTWMHFDEEQKAEVSLIIREDGTFRLDDGMCDSPGVKGKLDIHRVTPSWINTDIPLEKDTLSFAIGMPLRSGQEVTYLGADCVKDRGEMETKLTFSKVEKEQQP